jgi:hypothetical protein
VKMRNIGQVFILAMVLGSCASPALAQNHGGRAPWVPPGTNFLTLRNEGTHTISSVFTTSARWGRGPNRLSDPLPAGSSARISLNSCSGEVRLVYANGRSVSAGVDTCTRDVMKANY